jgi:hypothetical protein
MSIKAILCGEDHVLLQDEKGKVWSWGRGELGQLGHGEPQHAARPASIVRLEPHMLGKNARVMALSCGSNFNAAVTDGGGLYTWGGNGSGQLGHGDAQPRAAPQLVAGMHRRHVQAVACGGGHTIALTTARDVFTWGRNTHGQLGHGAGRKATTAPRRRVMGGIDVKQLAAGENHSAVLTSTGDIYTWGRGDYGQLGLGDFLARDVPTQLTALDQRAQAPPVRPPLARTAPHATHRTGRAPASNRPRPYSRGRRRRPNSPLRLSARRGRYRPSPLALTSWSPTRTRAHCTAGAATATASSATAVRPCPALPLGVFAAVANEPTPSLREHSPLAPLLPTRGPRRGRWPPTAGGE